MLLNSHLYYMNAADQENYATWNKLADLYARHFMDLDTYTASYAQFCGLLSTDRPSLLEIGCGPGNITRHLLRLLPKARILATDFSENMVDSAQKYNPQAECRVLDARNIGMLEEKFDGIICGFVLPYLSPEDSSSLLADCHTLLQKNGLLYLSFVPGNPAESGYVTGSTGDRCFFHFFDRVAFLIQMRAHFEILDDTDVAYRKKDGSTEIHTLVIARKRVL